MAGEEERVENGGRKKTGEVKKGRSKKGGEIWQEKKELTAAA